MMVISDAYLDLGVPADNASRQEILSFELLCPCHVTMRRCAQVSLSARVRYAANAVRMP